MKAVDNVKDYLSSMNKTTRNVGIAVLAAGALAYPAYRLYKYAVNRRKSAQNKTDDPSTEHATKKSFAPSYLGDHRPHHGHPENREANA